MVSRSARWSQQAAETKYISVSSKNETCSRTSASSSAERPSFSDLDAALDPNASNFSSLLPMLLSSPLWYTQKGILVRRLPASCPWNRILSERFRLTCGQRRGVLGLSETVVVQEGFHNAHHSRLLPTCNMGLRSPRGVPKVSARNVPDVRDILLSPALFLLSKQMGIGARPRGFVLGSLHKNALQMPAWMPRPFYTRSDYALNASRQPGRRPC